MKVTVGLFVVCIVNRSHYIKYISLTGGFLFLWGAWLNMNCLQVSPRHPKLVTDRMT